jgi:hypothetical protein
MEYMAGMSQETVALEFILFRTLMKVIYVCIKIKGTRTVGAWYVNTKFQDCFGDTLTLKTVYYIPIKLASF